MTDWGPFSLDGKGAVVTGGSLGIGWGITSRFVEAGANVLVADLDPDPAKAKIEELANPSKATAIQVDVADEDAGTTIVEAAADAFGSIDILVNNAGIFPQVPMLDMEPSLWNRIIDINLTGLAFVTQAVARHMVATGAGGKIINIASIDGLHPSMVGLAAYDASKGGVVMFTRSLALELAPHGINVNAIAPGGVATEGTQAMSSISPGMTQEELEEMMGRFLEAKVPLRRMGDPDEIATAAVFLASSASSYMAREIVVVDGGTLLT